MKAILANPAGACYGVHRALDMAFQAIEDVAATSDGIAGAAQKVYTLGPLIHNPRVVAVLEAKGVKAIDDIDSLAGLQAGDRGDGGGAGDGDEGRDEAVEAGSSASTTLIIRSHGVPKGLIERARSRGLRVVDATCPHVRRAQAEASRLASDGRLVVILGEAGHPEVEAILSYAGGNAVVIEDADVVADLPDAPTVGLVVQTTQPTDRFDGVAAALKRRYGDVELCHTICAATEDRQKAAVELALRVDAMVVIGGRISGNTRRLAQLCGAVCPKTHHVESVEELDPAWFSGCMSVGVTAGASTPTSQIDPVLRELERL